MSPSQAEYTVARTYVEWICDLPWKKASKDKIKLDEVRDILNADHYGLEKVKKRIVEFLAVRKLKSDMKGPILCLAGPPGTGKTSPGSPSRNRWGANLFASLWGVFGTRQRSAAPTYLCWVDAGKNSSGD